MTPRSLLFVPGDSPRKIANASNSLADALILDLEDSVTADNKAAARTVVAAFLETRLYTDRTVQLWVRINPLDSPHALSDLTTVVGAQPDGIILPKADGPTAVLRLSHYLDVLEVQAGIDPGAIRIIPVATETAAATFTLGDYRNAHLPRLAALTWGAEDLSTALGASTNRAPDGAWAATYTLVRSMTLLAAHAAGVPAIETLYDDFRDADGLLRACSAARSEGFAGRLAIHPAQVGPINQGFTPSDAELKHAHRIVAAFAAEPSAGAVGLDGRMIDRPHLVQAERLLAAVGIS